MQAVGNLSKMVAKPSSPIEYELLLGETRIALNPYLGKALRLEYTRQIHCIACRRGIPKSYQDGYCFPCTQKLAQCDLCIVRPERCHFHLGTCREPEWAKVHCMDHHIVYLANSSGLKVGITRKTQTPTRWIDQGAVAALPFLEVATRRISGQLEIILSKHVADKTNWRQMLMGLHPQVDLVACYHELWSKLEPHLTPIYEAFGTQALRRLPVQTYDFHYPVLTYPTKITSLSFDKNSCIEGTLLGIKGQYLIFDKGVINIRKHSGYLVELTAS